MRRVGVAFGRLPDGTIYHKQTFYDGGLHHVIRVLRPGSSRWRSWSTRHLASGDVMRHDDYVRLILDLDIRTGRRLFYAGRFPGVPESEAKAVLDAACGRTLYREVLWCCAGCESLLHAAPEREAPRPLDDLWCECDQATPYPSSVRYRLLPAAPAHIPLAPWVIDPLACNRNRPLDTTTMAALAALLSAGDVPLVRFASVAGVGWAVRVTRGPPATICVEEEGRVLSERDLLRESHEAMVALQQAVSQRVSHVYSGPDAV